MTLPDDRCVLVVDDHTDTCHALARLLARHGYRVRQAHSFDAAVAEFARDEVDLLLSDIAMPGRNGLDLVRALRASHPDLPAIAISAHASDVDVAQAREAGFSAHIAKPADFATVKAAIDDALA